MLQGIRMSSQERRLIDHGIDLAFCEEYNYPIAIGRALTSVVSTVLTTIPATQSIILTGSTCRGELSYVQIDSELRLLSDFELIAVVPTSQSLRRASLPDQQNSHLSSLFDNSPLFHVDLSIVTLSQLRHFFPVIFTYETRENGRVLWEKNLVSKLPEVHCSNLDIENVNELVLVRLLSLLLCTPRRVVLGTASTYEQLIFQYIQYRNILDVLTIMLPNEGVLLSDYRSKVDYVSQHYEDLSAKEFFGSDFSKLMGRCLHGKLHPEFNQDVQDTINLYRVTVKTFRNLIRFIVYQHYGSRLMPEFNSLDLVQFEIGRGTKSPLRRMARELRAARNRDLPPVSMLRWLAIKRKQTIMIAFLLEMHAVLLDILIRQKAEDGLGRAREYLRWLLVKPIPDPVPNPHLDWLALRNSFAELYMDFFHYNAQKRNHVQRLLGWEDAT